MAPSTGLGDRLRAQRTALNLTLAEVAERSGLSLPYVSNLERGRGNPTLEALSALAAALEMPLASIVGDSAEEVDTAEIVLANAPGSLVTFVRSTYFKDRVDRLAKAQSVDADQMRRRVMVGMASAPRRSTGDPTEADWKRLLDAYSLILQED